MKKISRLAALLTSFSVPFIAAAQTGINTGAITPYSEGIKNVINNILVPVLMALAFIVFLWGVYKYFILGASSDTERKTGRDFTFWGIIGFVIILSVWGIVNLFMSTLGLSAGTPPPFPTIGGSTGGGGNMTAAQTATQTALQSKYSACQSSGSASSAACTTYNQDLSTYNTQYPYDYGAGAGSVSGLANGAECAVSTNCTSGYCAGAEYGYGGVCANYDYGTGSDASMGLANGAECAASANCSSGYCAGAEYGYGGVCADASSGGTSTVGPGENCDSYNTCPSGYVCDEWGTCS